MHIPVISFTEALLNPAGRFRSLDGIFPLRDRCGEPVLSLSTHTVNYPVEWRGGEYMLKCFITDDSAVRQRARLMASRIDGALEEHIARMDYLDGEMLVFDIHERPSYHDVVLQRRPEGMTLGEVVPELCLRGDRKTLRRMLGGISDLSAGLHRHGFEHGNLKPSNILVTPDHRMLLVNLENASVGGSCERDNYPLGIIAAVLYISAACPGAYDAMRARCGKVFIGLRQFLPEIASAAEVAGDEALCDLVRALCRSRLSFSDRETLNGLIAALVAGSGKALEIPISASPGEDGNVLHADVSGYDEAGEISDTLRRVMFDERWFYIDRRGNSAVPGEFDFADDFVEGRAVVGSGDSFGLINRDGGTVLPMIFEEIRWFGDHGVAIACFDGVSALFNRSGERLTKDDYLWMGDVEEGLIAAELDGRYGYIGRDGSVAIPFRFDNAYDFRRGRAIEIDGAEYYIDPGGVIIEKVVQGTIHSGHRKCQQPPGAYSIRSPNNIISVCRGTEFHAVKAHGSVSTSRLIDQRPHTS